MSQKPPQNPSNRRRLTTCHRHPSTTPTTTGLCASCLRERLSLLTPSTSSSSAPELRRCKTFSRNNRAISFEPRRRSCDVRSGNALSTLFNLDDDDVTSRHVESRNLGLFSQGTCLVPELKEEEEGENEEEDDNVNVVEARVSDFEDNVDCFEESKTMKEFIDLEYKANSSNKACNRKDFKEIAGSFWVAASVFSKKLRKWRKKQGGNNNNNNKDKRFYNGDGYSVGLGDMRLDKLRGRRLRDTQSEVGEYGFGRRSCDTDLRMSIDVGRASIDCGAFGIGGGGRMSCDTEDARFSIDLGRASVDCGRISVDEGRCSFDQPRASWDGYLVGRRGGLACGSAPVVSVIENAMATVYGFDHHRVMADVKLKMEHGDRRDSSSFNQVKDRLDFASMERRKMGFDGTRSIKRDMVVTEDGALPNAIGILDGTKLLITEKELNEWRLNPEKDDSSESFETASKDLASVSSSSNGNSFKKCRQWSKLWNIWGYLNRKKGQQCQDERISTARNDKKEVGSDSDRKFVRSQSTSSSRGSSSTTVGSALGSESRSVSNAIVRRRQEDSVLERGRSAKLSSNHLDHGLLRFYLTPLRSRRRNKPGKSRLKNPPFLVRSTLR